MFIPSGQNVNFNLSIYHQVQKGLLKNHFLNITRYDGGTTVCIQNIMLFCVKQLGPVWWSFCGFRQQQLGKQSM